MVSQVERGAQARSRARQEPAIAIYMHQRGIEQDRLAFVRAPEQGRLAAAIADLVEDHRPSSPESGSSADMVDGAPTCSTPVRTCGSRRYRPSGGPPYPAAGLAAYRR